MFEMGRKERSFTRDLFLSFNEKNPLTSIEIFDRQFQLGDKKRKRSKGDG
jgi:hypothetical protein